MTEGQREKESGCSSSRAPELRCFDLSTEAGVRAAFIALTEDFFYEINSAMARIEDKNGDVDNECAQSEFLDAVTRAAPAFELFAHAFAGQAPLEEFKVDRQWHGAPLGRHLKNRLAVELMGAPREIRETVVDDADYVHFAMSFLMKELVATFLSTATTAAESSNPFTPDPFDACRDLADRWADMFVKPTSAGR